MHFLLSLTHFHTAVFVCPHAIVCFVLPYVCSILGIPVELVRRLMVIHLPALCHWASRSAWHQPLTSSHIVLRSTSHQLLMPTVAMWSYLSLWSCPRCLPVALSVTKRLLGTNPSCHSRQWIIAPNLSAFMTRVHIDYQLQTQQTTLYTRSVPAAQ